MKIRSSHNFIKMSKEIRVNIKILKFANMKKPDVITFSAKAGNSLKRVSLYSKIKTLSHFT
jgi:hypothetical protein